MRLSLMFLSFVLCFVNSASFADSDLLVYSCKVERLDRVSDDSCSEIELGRFSFDAGSGLSSGRFNIEGTDLAAHCGVNMDPHLRQRILYCSFCKEDYFFNESELTLSSPVQLRVESLALTLEKAGLIVAAFEVNGRVAFRASCEKRRN